MSVPVKLAVYLAALVMVLGASFALGRAVGSDEDPATSTTTTTTTAPIRPAPTTEPTSQHSGAHDPQAHP